MGHLIDSDEAYEREEHKYDEARSDEDELACPEVWPESLQVVIKELQETIAKMGYSPSAHDALVRLTVDIWEKHYKATSPNFKILKETVEIVDQIENMVSGMSVPNEFLEQENAQLKAEVFELTKKNINEKKFQRLNTHTQPLKANVEYWRDKFEGSKIREAAVMKKMRLQDGTKILFDTDGVVYFLEGPIISKLDRGVDLLEGWEDIMPEFKWEGEIKWVTSAQWCSCIYLENRAFAVKQHDEWQVIKFAEQAPFKLRDVE